MDFAQRVPHKGLDSFRLFAFLAVFLFHTHVFEGGYLGVLAFFVLSGFLITPILVEMRRRLPTGRYFLNFYGRRSLRIFPLYYFYLAGVGACAVLAHALNRVSPAIGQISDQMVYALSYTYDFFHASWAFAPSWLLTHLWSLAVEEQFYLVWPFVIFWAAGARLKSVLLVLLAAGPAIRLAEAVTAGAIDGWFFSGLDRVVWVLPFSHIDAFAMGGYMALYGRTPARAIVAWYAGMLLLVGMVTEWFAVGSTGLTLGYGSFMSDSWKYLWGYTAVNLLFGWILLLIRDRALMPVVVENRALAHLGKISYGLYVYHSAVIWLLSKIDAPGPGQPGVLWQAFLIVAMLTVTVLLSMASYAFLEAPFLRLKDRYFARDGRRARDMPVAITVSA